MSDPFEPNLHRVMEFSPKRFTAYAMWWRDGFWFRVQGWGLNVHRRSTHLALFSERHGRVRWRYFGPVCWRLLRPSDWNGR